MIHKAIGSGKTYLQKKSQKGTNHVYQRGEFDFSGCEWMPNTKSLTKRQLEQAEALKQNLQRRKAQRQGRRSVEGEKLAPEQAGEESLPLSSGAQDVKTVE